MSYHSDYDDEAFYREKLCDAIANYLNACHQAYDFDDICIDLHDDGTNRIDFMKILLYRCNHLSFTVSDKESNDSYLEWIPFCSYVHLRDKSSDDPEDIPPVGRCI